MTKAFPALLADFPDFPAASGPADFVRPLIFAPNSLVVLGANTAYGCRVIIPKTGVLHDLAAYVGVSSGNVDIGVYDTTLTTRNKLYSSGSIACPAANGWRIFADPALYVTAGQHLDLVLVPDNATASFLRFATGAANAWWLPTGFLTSPLGGIPKWHWSKVTTFPLPATLAESALAQDQTFIQIIARVV